MSTGNSLKGQVGAAGSTLAQGLRSMMTDTNQYLSTAAASGDAALDAARDRFADQVKQMQARLDDFEEVGMAQARRAVRAADQTVHAHPYGAMGLAAAGGLVMGLLLGQIASRRG